MGDDVIARLFDKMDDLKGEISSLRTDVEVLTNEVKHSNSAQIKADSRISLLEGRVTNTETAVSNMQQEKRASNDIIARLISLASICIAGVGLVIAWFKKG